MKSELCFVYKLVICTYSTCSFDHIFLFFLNPLVHSSIGTNSWLGANGCMLSGAKLPSHTPFFTLFLSPVLLVLMVGYSSSTDEHVQTSITHPVFHLVLVSSVSATLKPIPSPASTFLSLFAPISCSISFLF